MGHMIEKVLTRQGIELAAATEDVCATPPELAAECVCIDFTFPQSFRANYKFLADKFKAVVVGTTGWEDIKEAHGRHPPHTTSRSYPSYHDGAG